MYFNNFIKTSLFLHEIQIKNSKQNKQVKWVRNDQARSDRNRSDRVKNDRVRSDRVRSDRVRSDRVRNDSGLEMIGSHYFIPNIIPYFQFSAV